MELGQNFERVTIDTSAAGTYETLKAAASGKVQRLHALHVRMVGAGTLKVQTTTTGDSGTDLCGALPLAANAGIDWDFDARQDSALASTSGGYLRVGSTGTTVKGWSVISVTTA
jgi:hypothetical protein